MFLAKTEEKAISVYGIASDCLSDLAAGNHCRGVLLRRDGCILEN